MVEALPLMQNDTIPVLKNINPKSEWAPTDPTPDSPTGDMDQLNFGMPIYMLYI